MPVRQYTYIICDYCTNEICLDTGQPPVGIREARRMAKDKGWKVKGRGLNGHLRCPKCIAAGKMVPL